MSTCPKVGYPNITVARSALTAIRHRHQGSGRRVPAAIYPCPSCQLWHLTSRRPAGRKALKWTGIPQ